MIGRSIELDYAGGPSPRHITELRRAAVFIETHAYQATWISVINSQAVTMAVDYQQQTHIGFCVMFLVVNPLQFHLGSMPLECTWNPLLIGFLQPSMIWI